MALLDTFYMIIFAAFMYFFGQEANLLLAFDFYHDSYFVRVGLVVWFFVVTIDRLLKVIIN